VSPDEALASCEAAVRRYDPDRYFASLFAPAARRPMLFALYAFNHEIAHAVEVAREPMMAEIRLQWWREAVDDAREGHPRAQPAAIGLSELVGRGQISSGALEAMIDARAEEISSAPFADLAALEAHAAATSGALMRIAASVLNGGTDVGGLMRDAGVAYGLAGIIRAVPFHVARGKPFLPADLLAAEGLTTNDALSARHGEALKRVISRLADGALAHFRRAQRIRITRQVLPAALPASLVPACLSHAMRLNRSPLRDSIEVSLFRRQLILLRAASLGRL
jgi:15-cis-phytoene synthase